MLTRQPSAEQVVLVHVEFSEENECEQLEECSELVRSTGAEVVAIVTGKRHAPTPKYFVGTGKADEIREAVVMHKADIVIVNHALSPSQERNLERLVECRVLDRVGLILDIFASRARSFEGKLQVELAQLQHLSTRLVRGWTHLERQKGGIGLRGPGETQLETDRRLIRARINTILKRLEKVRRRRDQGRRARRKADVPTISLVGYTNAGKSTLFNALTEANVYAADQLFATLDPTLRQGEFPGIGHAVLADTVGFIRHLPHDLVEAFQATLEETQEASLILHVIDMSSGLRQENIEAVNAVLDEIEANDVPQLLVYNKIDLQEGTEAHVDSNADGYPQRVWISAETGEGMALLREAIVACLAKDLGTFRLCLQPQAGPLRAALYALNAILVEKPDEAGGWKLTVRLSERVLKQLLADHPGMAALE